MPDKNSVLSDNDAIKISRTEELAYELKISEVMSKNVKSLPPMMKMETALDVFQRERFSGAPVVQSHHLIGILSIEDLIRYLRGSFPNAKVSDFMSSNPSTVYQNEAVIEALKIFSQFHFGRLPVLNKCGDLVGIITKGDISAGLLTALQKDYQSEDIIRYRASHLFEDIVSDRTSLILRYDIKKGDFTHGGNASNKIKRALLRIGASKETARRCGIATYEAEINLIIHTNNGGTLRVEIEPHKITVEAYDDGPGIDDVDQAMQPGFSTASPETRKMVFGAGMGLYNIKRCADEMRLVSSKEQGTNLYFTMYLKKGNDKP